MSTNLMTGATFGGTSDSPASLLSIALKSIAQRENKHGLEAYATLRRRVVTPGARRELLGCL
jgi:hypothetical protein